MLKVQGSSKRYEQALEVLHGALEFGIHPSLDGITALAGRLGSPHNDYACIQVGGTNGKTSTARLIAALLTAHGHKTGLYTSPELVYYEERVEIDGAVIARDDFATAVLDAHEAAEGLVAEGVVEAVTEFELLTAAGLALFSRHGVRTAVLEVGLGGRWDATSVVRPAVAVVSGIGLDHTAILGDTLELVAREKAAIIRQGTHAVLGPGTADTRSVFLDRIHEVGAEARVVDEGSVGAPTANEPHGSVRFVRDLCPDGFMLDVETPLASYRQLDFSGPGYQAANIATAIAAAEVALGGPLDHAATQQALASVRTPGRFELLRDDPLLVIDASHNPQSASVLADELIRKYGTPVPAVLLLGILADKDADGIIDALTPLFSEIAVTCSQSPRAISPDELAARVAQRAGISTAVYSSAALALKELTQAGKPVIATGSITIAGEVKRAFLSPPASEAKRGSDAAGDVACG
ncbi:MAG: bifunctional folylpolyglutamate synthase/dihydrofolate synthase [Coriobacteriales bacterium]|nr:bifunctional folylpolyglutamate synthase/dihydrofolate synthase [Coriobacteriales bacterium]